VTGAFYRAMGSSHRSYPWRWGADVYPSKLLAESTLTRWESAVAGHAEVSLNHWPDQPDQACECQVRLRESRGRGEGALGRGTPRRNSPPTTLPGACRGCGVILKASNHAWQPAVGQPQTNRRRYRPWFSTAHLGAGI